jgi:hypothetical protein
MSVQCPNNDRPLIVVEYVLDRAVRRTRRAGLTGSVRRIADPFRRGFEKKFDGTATGRISQSTAVEMTAADRQPTVTGSDDT